MRKYENVIQEQIKSGIIKKLTLDDEPSQHDVINNTKEATKLTIFANCSADFKRELHV